MPRSRNIKPGICQNEHLAELSCRHRFLFAVLPCFADRKGRMEDRPRKLKMQIFPADNCDMDVLLQDLHSTGMVLRYECENIKYIQIVNFSKHQNPHVNEKDSDIPEPPEHDTSTVQEPCKHGGNRADSLLLIPDSFKHHTSNASRFDEWWDVYPKKVDKKKSKAIWKRRKLDKIADTLITDVQARIKNDRKWIEGFITNPTTYLNGDRWEDEIDKTKPKNQGLKLPASDEKLWDFAKEHNLPDPGHMEDFFKYRQRLKNEIERRTNA